MSSCAPLNMTGTWWYGESFERLEAGLYGALALAFGRAVRILFLCYPSP
ncbi:MAG TPA: hypothetical protein VFK06_18650 [Candidatus Angelobacter sp.]|nr:hypothetical protein [Candidatus Angelobacter sp.]